MTSIIKFHAFSGVQGETPPCYMLQIDEFRFLLDCGWDEKFDLDALKEVKKHIPMIDAVLLSHPDHLHLGALPHLVGKCGLACPIYATVPVYKMGQMFMYDLYQSRHSTEDFDIFTLDDVDAAFDKVVQLKYSQTVSLTGKGQGLQITPLPAGHMIGGTIWKIVKDGEEEMVYAVDYNHKKERHLNGCELENMSKPSLMITDALNATYTQARRRQRDEQLMTNILTTLREGGNVLVAIDTAGRVLEIAQLLDQLWRNKSSGLMVYNLALLNNVSYNVVEFSKSQVEWMSDKIMRAFEDGQKNPFQFQHVQLCHSRGELAKVREPKVVLASVPDLESGFSRELFTDWCTNPANTIILTSRTSPETLARKLIDNPDEKQITLEIRKRVRLEGAELEEHLKDQKEKEAIAAAEKEKLQRDDEDSSDESDIEVDIITPGTKHDLMIQGDGKSRGGFFKVAKKSYPMYPFVEEKLKWDEYGEIIRHDDYIQHTDINPKTEEPQDILMKEQEEAEDNADIPTKCISYSRTLDILANVVYIDFEGRSDGESLRKIISQIKPKQLILVRGSPESTTALAEYCSSSAVGCGKVFTPEIHQVIDATTEGFIYQVKLKDSLVSALQIYKAKDLEVAWVDGQLNMAVAKTDTSAKYEPEEGEVAENKKDDDDEMDVGNRVPTLEPFPSHEVPGHTSVFINEPRLSDLKTVMLRAGIMAEFVGGVLTCNNVVAVKRSEAGRIQIEGALSEDYYKVREIIYGQFAIV